MKDLNEGKILGNFKTLLTKEKNYNKINGKTISQLYILKLLKDKNNLM